MGHFHCIAFTFNFYSFLSSQIFSHYYLIRRYFSLSHYFLQRSHLLSLFAFLILFFLSIFTFCFVPQFSYSTYISTIFSLHFFCLNFLTTLFLHFLNYFVSLHSNVSFDFHTLLSFSTLTPLSHSPLFSPTFCLHFFLDYLTQLSPFLLFTFLFIVPSTFLIYFLSQFSHHTPSPLFSLYFSHIFSLHLYFHFSLNFLIILPL